MLMQLMPKLLYYFILHQGDYFFHFQIVDSYLRVDLKIDLKVDDLKKNYFLDYYCHCHCHHQIIPLVNYYSL